MAETLPAETPPVETPPANTVVPVGDPPPAETPPEETWMNTVPDTWREDIAGEDESRLNQLKRIASFDQFATSYFDAQAKIHSGQIEAAAIPTEESSDEEWSDYRSAQGIPETAEGYEVNLEEGLVLGSDDQEILDLVYPIAHQNNVPAKVVSDLANALLDGQAQQYHRSEIQQGEFMKEADARVREVWRGDYEVNKNLIQSAILNSIPEAVREEFAHATLADGRKVFNSPEMLIVMAEWARVINPAATVVPNNANPMQAIANELEELEKRIGSPEWYKDKPAQDRYQDLIRARDNLNSQG